MRNIFWSARFSCLFYISTAWTSGNGGNGNDRSFPKAVKDDCWEKFPGVEGRDPNRWRYDAVGNIVSFTLRGCDGCLCHEYDHIVPFSKGGESTLANCQLLQQRVNRYKGNENNDRQKLESYSCQRRFTDRELNVVEMAIYGDVRDEEGSITCRCKSAIELFELGGSDDQEFSCDEEELYYEADADETVFDQSESRKQMKKKRWIKKKKNKKAKEKRRRAESIDFGTDEKSRPPIDSYKYTNCK